MASGFLENLWNSDAGILQKDFFFTKIRLDGRLELRCLLLVPTVLFGGII